MRGGNHFVERDPLISRVTAKPDLLDETSYQSTPGRSLLSYCRFSTKSHLPDARVELPDLH